MTREELLNSKEYKKQGRSIYHWNRNGSAFSYVETEHGTKLKIIADKTKNGRPKR